MKNSPVRQNIIETASRLFYQHGYNLTGINEIIKEAGIAKATLYNHFKSKDEICLAYLEYKNVAFLKDIETFARKAKQGVDQCLALFDFLDIFFENNEFNGCWCINTVSELPREEEQIREEIQRQKHKFIGMIHQLISDNLEIHSTQETELLAKQVYLLYEGAISESHLHQEKWPIEAGRRLCKKLLT